MKDISIIIPVYNVEKYIERCLNSVYQIPFNNKEFEIIVIDDESPDDSIKLVKEHFSKQTNLKIFSQSNKGLGGARNLGIQKSTGEYLVFLDADDQLTNNIVELLKIATTNNLDILEFGSLGKDEFNKTVYKKRNSSKIVMNGIEYYKNIRYMNSACNKLYRRDFLFENNLCFLDRIFIEDFEFNTRAFLKAKKVIASPIIGSHFYQTQDSITRNTNEEKGNKMLIDIFKVLEITKDLYNRNKNLSRNEIDQFLMERMSFLNLTLIVQMIKQKKVEKDVNTLLEKLKSNQLYYLDYIIFDKSKNMVRIMLNNSFLLKFILKLSKLL